MKRQIKLYAPTNARHRLCHVVNYVKWIPLDSRRHRFPIVAGHRYSRRDKIPLSIQIDSIDLYRNWIYSFEIIWSHFSVNVKDLLLSPNILFQLKTLTRLDTQSFNYFIGNSTDEKVLSRNNSDVVCLVCCVDATMSLWIHLSSWSNRMQSSAINVPTT